MLNHILLICLSFNSYIQAICIANLLREWHHVFSTKSTTSSMMVYLRQLIIIFTVFVCRLDNFSAHQNLNWLSTFYNVQKFQKFVSCQDPQSNVKIAIGYCTGCTVLLDQQ